MSKVKTWADLSEQARTRFLHEGDWHNHFSKEIIEEAHEFYAVSLEPGETGQGRAGAHAWTYALGASRFMQKP